MHPMVLLGDEAQVVACFGPFRDNANLDAKQVHGLCRTNHRLGNHFGRTRWNSLVMWVMSTLVLVYLETMLVSVQDRCAVCTKHSIGTESDLDALNETPR
jgi:hypothetical protein